MWEQCAEAILKAAGRDSLTDAEKTYLAERVKPILRRLQKVERVGGDPDAALKQILEEEASSVEKAKLIAKRTAGLNFRGRSTLYDTLKNTWFDDPASGVEAVIEGVNLDRPGARNSLANQITTTRAAKTSALIYDVESKGLFKAAESGAFDLEIRKYVADLDAGKDVGGYSKTARELGDVYRRHNALLRDDQNKAGAWIGKLPGFVTRQTHDMWKIKKAGMGTWVQTMKQRASEMLSEMTPKEADAWLKTQWTEFASGRHLGFIEPEKAPVAAGFRNLGKKPSQERTITFNTPEDEQAYFKQFGRGNSLLDSVMHSMDQGGRNIAIMRMFGPNAKQNVERVFDQIEKDLLEAGDIKKLEAFRKTRAFQMNKVWPTVAQDAMANNGSHAVQVLSQSLLNLARMADLGQVVPNSLSDMTTAASVERFFGHRKTSEYVGALGKIMANQTEILAKGVGLDHKRVAARMNVLLDGMYTHLLHGDASTGVAGGIADAAARFMKLSGGERWWNALRIGSIVDTATDFAREIKNPIDKLPVGMQAALRQYGLSGAEWDILRSMKLSDYRGSPALTAADILEHDPAAFARLVEGEVTTGKLERARQNVADKYGNLAHDRAEIAATTPTATARAVFMSPEERGTWVGFAKQQLFLYRSFILSFMKMHLSRELYGYHPDKIGLAGALKRMFSDPSNGQLLGLTSLIAGGAAMGVTSNALIAVAQGKQPLAPDTPAKAAKMLFDGLIKSGGLGLYGDLLVQQVNSRTDAADYLIGLMGPQVGRLKDAANIVLDAARGKFGKAGEKAAKLLYRSLPGQNLVYTRWATDYLLKHRMNEMINPGYLERMEERNAEQGTPYFVPPSSVVNGGSSGY